MNTLEAYLTQWVLNWSDDHTNLCKLQASPDNVIGDPDRNPHLHLEMAHARWAVLRARAHLAACELSEQISCMWLYHLKVKCIKQELEDADTVGVGWLCEQIWWSGQSLHHSPILQQKLSWQCTPCKFSALLLMSCLTSADIEHTVNDSNKFYVDLQ